MLAATEETEERSLQPDRDTRDGHIPWMSRDPIG